MNASPLIVSMASPSNRAGLRHRLLLYPPEQPALQLGLPATVDWLIGREEDCGLRLVHPSVSRRHARLTAFAGADVDGPRWQLEDLGSKNGTRCFVPEGAPDTSLSAGDWFAIGDVLGTIEAVPAELLHAEGRLVGAIYADSRQPGRSYDSLDAELLGALVDQASTVLVALELDDTLTALQRWLAVDAEGAAVAPAGPAPTLASLGISA